MTFDKWLVLGGGVIAIGWLNWRFFRTIRRRRDGER